MCVGMPGQLVEIFVEEHAAIVDVAGVRRRVNIGLLLDDEGIAVGDWVLIHVGFAMAKIDEAEARDTLAAIEELAAVYGDDFAELDEFAELLESD
ncbi:MAG: HypC/HybG/HupF family hydrogenase formation chaperone [Acidimicrobiales bacterium]